MPWVVDTSVLLDVLEDDPDFGLASAQTLDALAPEGLTLCPVSYAELAPSFEGRSGLQDEFLAAIGVDPRPEWTWEDTLRSHSAWNLFIQRKRAGLLSKRPIADILIGAFAVRHQGLITRNPKDFASAFPELTFRIPGKSGEDRT